jgi:serine/threonine protein kinase
VAPSSLIAPSSSFDRRRLGKYEVLCRLSTGGMSEIYLAHQVGLAGFNKLVVLKTILPDISGEEDFVRMFLDEARITAAFNHPNVAQVYELDTADEQLFMAMEFVQGCTLVELARACRLAKEAIPIGLTLAAVRDTALALHYAHTFTDARGRRQIVIHRDVAEKNIMVTYEGVTKLLDFGIAKALGRSGRTSVGMVKGTSGYMSPEQIRGEPLDGRSDIFALGVVAHECLTGLRLFHGKSAEDGMLAALKGDVAPPSKWNPQVPPAVDAAVMKALQRDREARFGTALEFAREVERVGQGLLWHPEQTGELVLKHFAERRNETRRLLESAVGQELTGEHRVQSLLKRVRSTQSTPGIEAQGLDTTAPIPPELAPQRKTPTPAPQLEGTKPDLAPLAARNAEAAPPRRAPTPAPQSEGTNPNIVPASLRPPESVTLPARPRSLTAEANDAELRPGRTPTGTTLKPPPPGASYDDDDEADAKTIPATSLPDDIRALRKRLAEAAEAKKAAPTPGPAAEFNVTAPRAEVGKLTDPAHAPLFTLDANPERLAPEAEEHTLSITQRQRPRPDWKQAADDDFDDDEVGARTAIAPPREVLQQINSRSSEDLRVTHDEALDPPPPTARGAGPALVALLVALVLLAIAGVLVLLDVIPVGGTPPTPAAAVAPPTVDEPAPPADAPAPTAE